MTKIAVVGEAWGRHEAEARRPLVGPTGVSLNRMLEEAGFPIDSARVNKALWAKDYNYRDRIYAEASIFPTNVFNFQPPGNQIEALCGPRWGTLPAIRPGKYIRHEFIAEVERLKNELSQHGPNLIIGLGATACWFGLGHTAITKQRGTVALSPYGKFICTYHPAFLMRGAGHLRPVVVADLMKARREAEYPEIRRPRRTIYIAETIDDIKSCFRSIVEAALLSIDIETRGDQITCIGFAWSPHHALVIPITTSSSADGCYWPSVHEPMVWKWIKYLCQTNVPKVFQNGLYDLNFLWARYGITVANCQHDTMLLHHALQPEMQKGLGFLGSIYTDEPAWKLARARGKETVKREDE